MHLAGVVGYMYWRIVCNIRHENVAYTLHFSLLTVLLAVEVDTMYTINEDVSH